MNTKVATKSRGGFRPRLLAFDLALGDTGDDAGLAMRRGLIAIAGRVGDGLGRAMIAGSVVAFGPVGRRADASMKRGTLALFGTATDTEFSLLPTFAPS